MESILSDKAIRSLQRYFERQKSQNSWVEKNWIRICTNCKDVSGKHMESNHKCHMSPESYFKEDRKLTTVAIIYFKLIGGNYDSCS